MDTTKAAGPKFYPGKGKRIPGVPPVSPSRRRESTELSGPVEIPSITTNFGGARSLSAEAQAELYFNYPPENCNKDNQWTPPPKDMPRSTTFGFGYNFDRAVQHHTVKGVAPEFRPRPLCGEVPKGKLGVAPFTSG